MKPVAALREKLSPLIETPKIAVQFAIMAFALAVVALIVSITRGVRHAG